MKTWLLFLFLSSSISSFSQTMIHYHEVDTMARRAYYIPNSFMSWDCDMSTRDGFQVFPLDSLPEFNILLFNRFGELVYQSEDIEGVYNPLNNDKKNDFDQIFIWEISFKCCGRKIQHRGYSYYIRR